MEYITVMKKMVEESARGPALFRPGPYWQPHADAMIELVSRHGIENFRRISAKAVQAFSVGNTWTPRFHGGRVIDRLPIIGAAIRDARLGHKRARNEANYKLHTVYAIIEAIDPKWLDVTDDLIGNPETFSIWGKPYSEIFLLKLLEIALLGKRMELSKIGSVLEIGGSYGVLGEILRKRYSSIRYTLVEIAPVAAFAQFYLGCTIGQDDGIRIFCAHQFNEIAGSIFDLFVNVGSFQEMSSEQVTHYCDFARHQAKAVYLNNQRNSSTHKLNTSDYARLLSPLREVARWNDPLHEGYQPILFGTGSNAQA